MFRTKYREYITFSVPINKELENGKTITYKIKFIFMSSSSSVFFIIQVLHILTENLQSPGAVSFSVPGNQPAKSCSKVN